LNSVSFPISRQKLASNRLVFIKLVSPTPSQFWVNVALIGNPDPKVWLQNNMWQRAAGFCWSVPAMDQDWNMPSSLQIEKLIFRNMSSKFVRFSWGTLPNLHHKPQTLNGSIEKHPIGKTDKCSILRKATAQCPTSNC
jgi:hypothetical protein